MSDGHEATEIHYNELKLFEAGQKISDVRTAKQFGEELREWIGELSSKYSSGNPEFEIAKNSLADFTSWTIRGITAQ